MSIGAGIMKRTQMSAGSVGPQDRVVVSGDEYETQDGCEPWRCSGPKSRLEREGCAVWTRTDFGLSVVCQSHGPGNRWFC